MEIFMTIEEIEGNDIVQREMKTASNKEKFLQMVKSMLNAAETEEDTNMVMMMYVLDMKFDRQDIILARRAVDFIKGYRP